jgi:hypothetical protein
MWHIGLPFFVPFFVVSFWRVIYRAGTETGACQP